MIVQLQTEVRFIECNGDRRRRQQRRGVGTLGVAVVDNRQMTMMMKQDTGHQ